MSQLLRAVVSTVGTSLLTKQINPKNEEERTWGQQLRDHANATDAEMPDSVRTIVSILQVRARNALMTSSILEIRRSSAELNGIYGLYQNDLHQGQHDSHFLIATDTFQGRTTAAVVEAFLQSHCLPVSCYIPPSLSTANSQSFSAGIDDLIVWMQKTIKPLRHTHRVYFNLVGSFKSLQGYLNTIGMFYADAILYIFEGQGSELITIPRLPIEIDTTLLAPHVTTLALMDAGVGMETDQVLGIPEAMVGDYQGKKVLSTWGKLTWDEANVHLLSQELLPFPKLSYTDTFRADFNKTRDPKQRAELQKVLAGVSCRLLDTNGNTRSLGAFDYSPYKNSKGIDHFRVTQSLRVSCRKRGTDLELRYYGTHNHVERKENV